MFLVRPECLISLVFCEYMLSNESISFSNIATFSNYTGYASKFRFSGKIGELAGRKESTIVALGNKSCFVLDLTQNFAWDALRRAGVKNYSEEGIRREILKAFVAFSDWQISNNDKISSGNWGCGAFTSKHRKLLATKSFLPLCEVSVSNFNLRKKSCFLSAPNVS